MLINLVKINRKNIHALALLGPVCEVVLVNARHVKNLPGKKRAVKDSRWLASLIKYGLLKGSFIPPKQVRQWRDLTRLRKKHVQEYKEVGEDHVFEQNKQAKIFNLQKQAARLGMKLVMVEAEPMD